jgi:methyltransferase (TIGR00027 family)
MNESKAIASAEMLAALRAAAGREASLSEPCSDPLARSFVGKKLARIADFQPAFLLKHVLRLRAPGAYPFAIARTRFFDAVLESELAAGARQLVILGAGYDSRACRFADQLSQATVFELDHPATQARKRALIASAGIDWPQNVRFVAVDFAVECFSERLLASGFETSRRTVILWEGVSYYLPPAAVCTVLDFASSCAADSAIAFDYALRSFVEGDHSSYGGAQVARWLTEIEEPFLFGLDPAQTADFLDHCNLLLESDLGPTDIEQLYLRTRRGGTLGPTLGHVRMAVARASNRKRG